MPNVEWSVPHSLVTPGGTINLNTLEGGTGPNAGRLWQISPSSYRIVPSVRATQDNVSQQDGSVIHPRFVTGLVATLTVSYLVSPTGLPDAEPACGADLREMHEQLLQALNSIRELPAAGTVQRLFWTPTGYGDQRLLDKIVLLSWPDPNFGGELSSIETQVQFSVESPLPYGIDSTQVPVPVSGAATITNTGNANFYPVIEVTATSNFTLTNTSVLGDDGLPLKVVFNAGLPGGVPVPGGGAEIDTFLGTIFATPIATNGADLIASIDPTLSDFWWLAPGANNITVTGTTATFKTNNAWA